MTIERKFSSWEEFEVYIKTFDAPPFEEGQRVRISRGNVLFRGHSNAAWNIETTLERACPGDFSSERYEQLIMNARSEIETFTGLSWPAERQIDFPFKAPEQIEKSFPYLSGFPGEYLANFDYMVYLRHFGFPSPLLDWTRSPYIAAYFATTSTHNEPWAIYIYDEKPSGFKISNSSRKEAGIVVVDRRDSFQRRHFLQQSVYTICLRHQTCWNFTPHEQVVELSNDANQDVLIKCIFSSSLQGSVLKLLDKININAFTLFGTDEALLTSLSSRCFQARR